jgi:hypothetical protein
VPSSSERGHACHKKQLKSAYYSNLASALSDVRTCNIFSYVETSSSDDSGKCLLILKRGIRYPENILNFSKSATFIMIFGSADGTLLPPYKCMWGTLCQNGLKESPCCTKQCCSQGPCYARTKHGLFDSQTFGDWSRLTRLPHAKRLSRRKVLAGDNISAHINVNVSEFEENILGNSGEDATVKAFRGDN